MDAGLNDPLATLWSLRTDPRVLMLGMLLAVAFLALRLYRTFSAAAARGNHGLLAKALDNWQLTLLAFTALVLSIASGWTTWDGMRNFTGEPVLSFLITFGIQGVMLIIAWLIGETFATQMGHSGRGGSGKVAAASSGVAVLLGFAVFVLWAVRSSPVEVAGGAGGGQGLATAVYDFSTFVLATGAAVALFVALVKTDVGEGYGKSLRVMAKNVVLWVMFLACMATSVFFSFDSLFSSIFPQGERARAAELRAQNQVAGVIADIGGTIEQRRAAEAQRLFTDKGWLGYEEQLVALAKAAQGSTADITRYFDAKIEERNLALSQQRERIATSQAGTAGLAAKKTTLVEELTRLKAERGTLAADYLEKKTELDTRARGVDAKRVEAQAEERGAEGSLKTGRGPLYRQRMDELRQLQEAYKIQEDRVRDAQRRSTSVDQRIAQIERELSTVDGDIAKLKGEADTADQRIKLIEATLPSDGGQRVDPDRLVPAFEAARIEFRQDPTVERLQRVQQFCAQLYGAMIATEPTRAKVRGLDCDPKQAAEAASTVFALNAGVVTFTQGCAGGDKLAQHTTADALFGFARKCLADSGLPSSDTDKLRSKINFIDLSRDDKAHRFVVTWNAFSDGNRLAYLALAIAVAIDSLVFMSGLFGANALRSPLSDVPSLKPRSAQQLEAIVENALLPDRFENAQLVLDHMHPITPTGGFTQEVLVPLDEAPGRRPLLKVLNAGATIGAVIRDANRPERYLARPELYEFLSVISKKEFEADRNNVKLAELKKLVVVSLQPHVGDHADLVLQHVHPINERNGFSSEVLLREVPAGETPVVRKLLNAGATIGFVQRDDRTGEQDRYYLKPDIYRTLAHISAEYPKTGLRYQLPQLPAGRPMPGTEGAPVALQSEPAPPLAPLPRGEAEPPRSLTGPAPQLADTHAEPAPAVRAPFDSFDAGGGEPIDQDSAIESFDHEIAAALADKLEMDLTVLSAILGGQHAVLIDDVQDALSEAMVRSDALKRRLDASFAEVKQQIALAEYDTRHAHPRLRERVSDLCNVLRKSLSFVTIIRAEVYPEVLLSIVDNLGREGSTALQQVFTGHRDAVKPIPRETPEGWLQLLDALGELVDDLDAANAQAMREVRRTPG
jgi:hypothetical protein